MKTKLQRLKTSRPAPGHLEIDAWIRQQENRLGITSENSEAKRSTVTVMLPSMAAVTRLAHAAADAKIAVDPAYDAICERLDAELAEIIEAGIPALPRAKSTPGPRVLNERLDTHIDYVASRGCPRRTV
jgi:cytochrome oxidase assembly protein ShyY1